MKGGYTDDFDPDNLALMQREAERLIAAPRRHRVTTSRFEGLPPGVCQYRAATTRSDVARQAIPLLEGLAERGYHLCSGTWVHPDGCVRTISPAVFEKCRKRVHRAGSRLSYPYALVGFIETEWNNDDAAWQVHEHFVAAIRSEHWQDAYDVVRESFITLRRLPGRVRVPLKVEPITDLRGWLRYESKGLMLHGNQDRRRGRDGSLESSALRDPQARELVQTLALMKPYDRVILSGEISRPGNALRAGRRRT